MILHKNYFRNRVIIAVSITVIIVMVIGLISKISIHDFLMALYLTTLIGFLGAFSIGWLLVKYLLPNLRIEEIPRQASISGQNISYRLTVKYELNINDVFSFYVNNAKHLLQVHNKRKYVGRFLLLGFFVEIFSAFVILLVMGQNGVSLGIAIGIIAAITLLYYFLSPGLWSQILRRSIMARQQQKLFNLIGKHELSFSPEGIEDITREGTRRVDWSTVNKISLVDQHLFITTTGSEPFIVPNTTFTDEREFKRLFDKIKAYYQAKS